MKSTLPFFAFVSLNSTPYVNQSIKNYDASEYLPVGNKVPGDNIPDNEERSIETMIYKKEQV